MDTLHKIISLQNATLLKRIAESKYDNIDEIKAFIDKYNKHNYHVLKISKNDDLLKYSYNRIINIQNAFDL